MVAACGKMLAGCSLMNVLLEIVSKWDCYSVVIVGMLFEVIV